MRSGFAKALLNTSLPVQSFPASEVTAPELRVMDRVLQDAGIHLPAAAHMLRLLAMHSQHGHVAATMIYSRVSRLHERGTTPQCQNILQDLDACFNRLCPWLEQAEQILELATET